jgi:hypothetical protein
MENEIRYSYKKIGQRQLEAELDKLWQQLWKDPELASEAREAGIDLTNLSAYSRKDLLTVSIHGDGLDPVTTALIVAFAPVAAKVAKDLWDKIFLPRILRDKGRDALVPKK